MLKVGGLLVYSTCSISPIEDEAVVVEMFRRLADIDQVELLDVHTQPGLQGFKGRRGMTHWPVYKQRNTYTRARQVEDQQNGIITSQEIYDKFHTYEEYMNYKRAHPEAFELQVVKESMFAGDKTLMDKVGIEKTMRVMPHDQNTGGFYVAIFKKRKDIVIN